MRPASATAGPIGTKSSPSERDEQHRVAQLARPGHPVGAGDVDRLTHPDEAPTARRAHQVGRHADQRAGHPVQSPVVTQHDAPVDDRGVEDHPDDVVGQRRAVERLEHDGATHRPTEQEDAPRPVGHGITHGGLDVAPLGQAEVVAPVRSSRGVAVVAIGGDETRPTGISQHRDGTERLLACAHPCRAPGSPSRCRRSRSAGRTSQPGSGPTSERMLTSSSGRPRLTEGRSQ